ncbi:Nif3-like dinuclear metal center hexameric protein [uncultured Marinococcus sp.]|uniref:Nif3-like dinuclear metal center hexameric protein n=1 Tax=uncultured Marinococcus sp. TaxID=487012 RepID=UPI0026345985|nr:Nif3-like dinuclear metal center hexameric protein [uncultured Marinococcus sp.]
MNTVRDVIRVFEEWAPPSLAVEGDRVGLMIGDWNQPVTKVLTTLDVSEEVVDEAVKTGVELIIAHHPLLFRPIKSLDVANGQGPVIEKCIKHDLTVYAAHTNLDIAPGGVNDMMAEALGLTNTEVLAVTGEDQLYKLVAFVPESHTEEVRQAVGDAGAGYIGGYSHCTFSASGTGTFIPGDGTDPFLGEQGKMEFADEKRMETIVPASLRQSVEAALTAAHPYEEPAYDMYPLALPGEPYGLGRVGDLPEEMTLEAFVEQVKKSYDVPFVRVVDGKADRVKRVALLGGDGNKYWKQALSKQADVYITGDIYFHTAQDAAMDGLTMMDPGHHVEKIMKKGVQKEMQHRSQDRLQVEWVASALSTEPFRLA